MKVLIIEDEKPAAEKLQKAIALAGKDIVIEKMLSSVQAATEWLQQHPLPDLIFMDIELTDGLSFKILENVPVTCPIIFTTAFDEYAIKAFESHAVDYLLKPFNQERFTKAVTKWREKKNAATENVPPALLETASQSPSQSQRIVVKNGSKIKIIPVHDIYYLEAADDYVKIHTQEGYFLKNKTMSHFEQTLDEQQFVRSHRSYIINIQQITRIDPYEKDNHVAILRSGVKVPVSRGGYGKLKLVLGL